MTLVFPEIATLVFSRHKPRLPPPPEDRRRRADAVVHSATGANSLPCFNESTPAVGELPRITRVEFDFISAGTDACSCIFSRCRRRLGSGRESLALLNVVALGRTAKGVLVRGTSRPPSSWPMRYGSLNKQAYRRYRWETVRRHIAADFRHRIVVVKHRNTSDT